MATIYSHNLLIPKYLNNKSLNNLSLVNKYWMLVTKDQRLLRNIIKIELNRLDIKII